MTELGTDDLPAIDEFDEQGAPAPLKRQNTVTYDTSEKVTAWQKIDTLHQKNMLERKMNDFCNCNTPGSCCLGSFLIGALGGVGLCTRCLCPKWNEKNRGKFFVIFNSIMGAIIIGLLTHLPISGKPLGEQMFLKVASPSYTFGDEAFVGEVSLSGWDYESSGDWEGDTLSAQQKEYRNLLRKLEIPYTSDSDWKDTSVWYEITNNTDGVQRVELGAWTLPPIPEIGILYNGIGADTIYQVVDELTLVKSIVDNPGFWKSVEVESWEDTVAIAKYAIPFQYDFLPMDFVEYKRWALSFWVAAISGMFMGYFLLRNMIDTVKAIMVERQNGTKDLMAFLGLNQYQYWMAQFYTHSQIYITSVFVNAFIYCTVIGELNRLHDFDLGGGIYVYVFFLFFISFANILLFGFACSAFLMHETFFDAWSLVAGILSIFLPQIFLVLLQNNDNVGERFILQFIPIFNFFFGLRDSIYGIQADTVIFHFVNLGLWTYLTLYFDLTIPTVKGARSKPHCYCLKQSQDSSSQELVVQTQSIDVDENEKFLHVSKLVKRYGDFTAVNQLDLDLPRNKLFGLLGFNGAGKTTTISMITGLVQPSDGTVKIAGNDVSTQIDSLRKIMGVCPQTNIMWGALTVQGHLQLFGRLRGFSDAEIERQGNELLKDLEMERVKDTLASELSGGQKRKLMVMQAFMGNPPFILLDEPTAGVDVESRESIQNLILNRKKDKLIILTTHHMSEADYLCEEIAIMAEGQISIRGTPSELKAKHGSGTTFELDAKESTAQLRATLEKSYDVDCEITPTGYLEVMCKNPEEVPSILREMEKIVDDGEIKIDNNSLESVFLNLANQQAQKTKRQSMTDLTSSSEKLQEILKRKYERPNVFVQFLLMNKKRAMLMYKDPSPVFQGVAVVVLFAVLALFSLIILGQKNNPKELPRIGEIGTPVKMYGIEELDFPQSRFFSDITANLGTLGLHSGAQVPVKDSPVDNDGKVEKACYNINMQNMPVPAYARAEALVPHWVYSCESSDSSAFKYVATTAEANEKRHVKCCDMDIFSWMPSTYCAAPAELGTCDNSNKKTYEEASQMCEDEGKRLCYQSEMGNCCTDITDPCYSFSFWTMRTEPYNADVKKLQVLTDAFYRPLAGTLMNYATDNAGVPQNLNNDGRSATDTNFFAAFITCLFLLMGGGQLLGSLWKYTGNEQTDRMYEQQVLTGVRGWIIWGANFLWDYALILIVAWVYCGIASGDAKTIDDVMIAWTMASIGYLWMTYTLGMMMDRNQLNTVLTSLGFLSFLTIFSLFFADGEFLTKMLNIDFAETSTEPDVESIWDNGYFKKGSIWLLKIPFLLIPPCQFFLSYWLELFETATESQPHLIKDSIYDSYYATAFFFNMIWFVLFLLVNVKWKADPKPQEVLVSPDQVGDAPAPTTVTAQKCSKVFRDGKGNPLIAVNNVSFDAYQGRCMGVLGKNGAGKSTMMNMLSTWYEPTQGRTTVRGLETTSNKDAVRDFIGICNQQNLYWNTFTAYEHLSFFGRLRGVPADEIDETIRVFAQELKFSEHLNTHMNSLSGGNKRKVALCASIIGKSEVLYLDEPSAGVDPFARDEMKNVLVQLKEGKTILFTSHTMEEAEIMCDELVIMKDGKVIEEGGVTDLVQRSSSGYYLHADISRMKERAEEIQSYIKNEISAYPQRAVKDGSLSFLVPFKSEKLSNLFAFSLEFCRRFPGATCAIESASLEQLFKHVVQDDNTTTAAPHVAIEMQDASNQEQGTAATLSKADSERI